MRIICIQDIIVPKYIWGSSVSRKLLYLYVYEDHLYPGYYCTWMHMRIICIQDIIEPGWIWGSSVIRILLNLDAHEDHLYPGYYCTWMHMRIICIQDIIVPGCIWGSSVSRGRAKAGLEGPGRGIYSTVWNGSNGGYLKYSTENFSTLGILIQSLCCLPITLKARNNFLKIFTNLMSSNPQFKSLELPAPSSPPAPPIKCVIEKKLILDLLLTETF